MKLTRQNMIGPWAGLPIAWNDDDTFDEKTYRQDIARCCAASIPGIYTGGTTGEFYALDFDEFKPVVKATIAECKQAGTPVMIGCSSTFTLGVIRRARYAQEQGADAIQVALPFWMEVPDREVVPFFKTVSDAVPGMPISIYETMRAKKVISVAQHRAIHKEVPAVIMVKSNENAVGRTPEGCAELSKLYNVFVSEEIIARVGPYGATGCCSALVYQNPRIVLHMFDLLAGKQWMELKDWTDKVHRLIYRGLKPCFDAGCTDSAIDRLLGLSAGFLKTSLRSRGPYPSCTSKMLKQFQQWLKRNMPEFLEL